MRFAHIDAEKALEKHTLAALCRALRVSPAGYHAWKSRKPSARAQADEVLGERLEDLFDESNGTYGSTRMHMQLQKESFKVSRKRIARIMHERGMVASVPKKWTRTTDSVHDLKVAPNTMNRDYSVEGPDRLWLTDISYIHTTEGFIYIAAILDAFSRRIVGYAVANHMRTELCEEALKMALRNRRPQKGLLHHSDRGSQYASDDYQALLDASGLVCSMSRKADCWDNAMMESFFGRLKNEHLYRLPLRSKARTKEMLTRWIEIWYNNKRVHTSLRGLSPVEFETAYWQEQKNLKEEKIPA